MNAYMHHPGDARPCCHPVDCQCARCHPVCPPRPCPTPAAPCRPPCCKPCSAFPPQGLLLPRILASGREWLRRACICLEICGLPDNVTPPLTLLQVRQSCDPPQWHILPESAQHQLCLHLCLPVDCLVQDACGGCFTGHSTVELDASMRLCFPACECWRHCLMVLPCIRLVHCAAQSCTPCFQAELEILVELYMVRWEPCLSAAPKPVCPALPLYPQPRLPE